jgi:hypothetical protein
MVQHAGYHEVPYWFLREYYLRHMSQCYSILNIFAVQTPYVTNMKVAGSRPDEVNDFYQVT